MHTLEDWLNKLKNSEKPILVEGKKDKLALENLGIKNKIITLKKRPLFKVIEDFSDKHKECILLTDLDNEGKKLFGKLNSGLVHHGVKIDVSFRNFLFRKTGVRQIEELNLNHILHPKLHVSF